MIWYDIYTHMQFQRDGYFEGGINLYILPKDGETGEMGWRSRVVSRHIKRGNPWSFDGKFMGKYGKIWEHAL